MYKVSSSKSLYIGGKKKHKILIDLYSICQNSYIFLLLLKYTEFEVKTLHVSVILLEVLIHFFLEFLVEFLVDVHGVYTRRLVCT